MILDYLFDPNMTLYLANQSLLGIIDALQKIFCWFADIMPFGQESLLGDSYTNSNPILNTLFNNPSVQTIFTVVAVISLFGLGLALIIALLKASFHKEDQPGAKRRILSRSFYSLMMILAMPVIFAVVISCVTVIINLIVQACGVSLGDSESLANLIGRACVTSGKGENFEWGMSFGDFKDKVCRDSLDFNFILCALGGLCVLVALFMACLTVIERIIHIIYLYIISPVVLAKSPLDDGKSMQQWTELCFSKFLSLAGTIICMYLFFIVMGVVNTLIDNSAQGLSPIDSKWIVLNVAKIVFCVAGAFTFTKAGTLFSHLVSSSAGQFEGMSMGQSSAFLGTAGRLGMAVVSKGAMGLRMGFQQAKEEAKKKTIGAGLGAVSGGNSAGGFGAMPLAGSNGAGLTPMQQMAMHNNISANGSGGSGMNMAYVYGGTAGGIGSLVGRGLYAGLGLIGKGFGSLKKLGTSIYVDITSGGFPKNDKVSLSGLLKNKSRLSQSNFIGQAKPNATKRASVTSDFLGAGKRGFNSSMLGGLDKKAFGGLAMKKRPTLGSMDSRKK